MCGIAGFFQTKYDVFNEHSCRLLTNKLTNMKKSIKHRGPDDDDIYLEGFAGLAHTRLSIRDLKAGISLCPVCIVTGLLLLYIMGSFTILLSLQKS